MIETVRAKAAPHDDLKSSLRQRSHTLIDYWFDENMANLVEDALQATPQSRTKPVYQQESKRHQVLITKAF